jgi:hypothetical protein
MSDTPDPMDEYPQVAIAWQEAIRPGDRTIPSAHDLYEIALDVLGRPPALPADEIWNRLTVLGETLEDVAAAACGIGLPVATADGPRPASAFVAVASDAGDAGLATIANVLGYPPESTDSVIEVWVEAGFSPSDECGLGEWWESHFDALTFAVGDSGKPDWVLASRNIDDGLSLVMLTGNGVVIDQLRFSAPDGYLSPLTRSAFDAVVKAWTTAPA